jgi:ribonuclease HI
MNPAMPHFLLFAETGSNCGKKDKPEECRAQYVHASSGAWRFVLRSVEGAKYFEAADIEPDIFGERLEMLTLVRALESLDQPSRVTLVGCSNYIRQGIQFGMAEWRANDWLWEWFGQMVPVKNADLWQRLDRLLAFHRVECSLRRIDGAHSFRAMPHYLAPREVPAGGLHATVKALSAKAWDRLPRTVRNGTIAAQEKLRHFALAYAKALRNMAGYISQRRDWGLRIAE